MDKLLRTVKRASFETGVSQSFFRKLVREKKLKRYSINSALYISLVEFQELASLSEKTK